MGGTMKRLTAIAFGMLALTGFVVVAGASAVSAHKAALTTVTSVSPQHGPTGGGTFVVIKGKNLVGATAVDFGSTPATTFSPKGKEIVATSPGEIAGTVDIRVTTSLGMSALNPPKDQFSYVTQPTIQSVTPRAGADTGGTKVTIAGTDFTGATNVEIGAVSVHFVIQSNQAITLVTPGPESDGADPVSVTTPDGMTPADSAATFTYASRVPIVRAIEPQSGPVGQQVTITGARFAKKGTTVDFGLTPATTVTVENGTTIVADSARGIRIGRHHRDRRKGHEQHECSRRVHLHRVAGTRLTCGADATAQRLSPMARSEPMPRLPALSAAAVGAARANGLSSGGPIFVRVLRSMWLKSSSLPGICNTPSSS